MIPHIPTCPCFLPYIFSSSSLLLLFELRFVAACSLDCILIYYSSLLFLYLYRHFLYKYEIVLFFVYIIYDVVVYIGIIECFSPVTYNMVRLN